jgi:hypothetical protein
MRITTLPPLLAFLSTARAHLDGYSPFIDPFAHVDSRPLLVKRQSCPANYNSCSTFGYSDACCRVNTNCALDDAGHIACCPFNAACTGTVGAGTGSVTSTSSGFVLGASSTTTSPATFITPTSGVEGGGSTVPNAPFAFVYIPTSFANQALCSLYWTSCQSESASCFSSLAGATGVTIAGPGVTSPGTAGASSICSELSASACYNLELPTCAQFPAATGAATAASTTNPFIQTTVAGAGGLRATGCPEMMYALGLGAIVGAAGVLV